MQSFDDDDEDNDRTPLHSNHCFAVGNMANGRNGGSKSGNNDKEEDLKEPGDIRSQGGGSKQRDESNHSARATS